MENYEERYKEALERAKKMQENSNGMILKKWLWGVFPELKECEDEKIRGAIIHFISHTPTVPKGIIDKKTMLAWLEKQKDYIKFPNSAYTSNKDVIEFANKYSHTVWGKLMDNFKIIENYSIGCNDVSDIVLNAIINTYNWLEKQGKQQGISALEAWKDMRLEVYQQASGNRHEPNYSDDSTKMFSLNDIDEIIEKISEQKLDDKVEPKFKPGDWIIFNGLILHIDEVVNGYYRTTSRGDGIHNSYDWDIDNAARLWTIQDAKDGDVLHLQHEGMEHVIIYKRLVKKVFHTILSVHCAYDGSTNDFFEDVDSYHCITSECDEKEIHPATKEQRDLLFRKMKEAGYEWDADKKELKNKEVVSKENEEERIREQLCDFLRDNMLYQDAQYFISWLEGKKKPADEVMKIRQKAYSDGYMHGQANIAISLGKESIEALEHFVRSIGESGYASPYDNRTKLVYRLLEQLKKIVNFIHC